MSPKFLGSTVRNSSKLMTDGHHQISWDWCVFFFWGMSIFNIDDSLFQRVQRSNLLKSLLWRCLLKACWKHHFQGLTQTQLAFSVACACCKEIICSLSFLGKQKNRDTYMLYVIYIYKWVSPKIGYPKSDDSYYHVPNKMVPQFPQWRIHPKIAFH